MSPDFEVQILSSRLLISRPGSHRNPSGAANCRSVQEYTKETQKAASGDDFMKWAGGSVSLTIFIVSVQDSSSQYLSGFTGRCFVSHLDPLLPPFGARTGPCYIPEHQEEERDEPEQASKGRCGLLEQNAERSVGLHVPKTSHG